MPERSFSFRSLFHKRKPREQVAAKPLDSRPQTAPSISQSVPKASEPTKGYVPRYAARDALTSVPIEQRKEENAKARARSLQNVCGEIGFSVTPPASRPQSRLETQAAINRSLRNIPAHANAEIYRQSILGMSKSYSTGLVPTQSSYGRRSRPTSPRSFASSLSDVSSVHSRSSSAHSYSRFGVGRAMASSPLRHQTSHSDIEESADGEKRSSRILQPPTSSPVDMQEASSSDVPELDELRKPCDFEQAAMSPPELPLHSRGPSSVASTISEGGSSVTASCASTAITRVDEILFEGSDGSDSLSAAINDEYRRISQAYESKSPEAVEIQEADVEDVAVYLRALT